MINKIFCKFIIAKIGAMKNCPLEKYSYVFHIASVIHLQQVLLNAKYPQIVAIQLSRNRCKMSSGKIQPFQSNTFHDKTIKVCVRKLSEYLITCAFLRRWKMGSYGDAHLYFTSIRGNSNVKFESRFLEGYGIFETLKCT